MDSQILNSKSISQLMYLPKVDEPDLNSLSEISGLKIFVGNSYNYSMPVILDFNKLLNPHILIVGMTGSGKTFLMKSLILRLSVLEESRIILIDLTGEYQSRLKMQIAAPENTKIKDYDENEITYFNLAGRN